MSYMNILKVGYHMIRPYRILGAYVENTTLYIDYMNSDTMVDTSILEIEFDSRDEAMTAMDCMFDTLNLEPDCCKGKYAHENIEA